MRRFWSEFAAGLEQAKKLQLDLILEMGRSILTRETYAIDRQVDVRTGTLRIAALFPNPTDFLRPGQFARVRRFGRH